MNIGRTEQSIGASLAPMKKLESLGLGPGLGELSATFASVPDWAALVPDCPAVVLVGNKTDRIRSVATRQGEDMAASLAASGRTVAFEEVSALREEDAQRAVPKPEPLTLDEFKRTKEYRDALESDELVANTLREVREREERTRRDIDELKKKRLEQRRVHADAVDAIRAETDGKLRGGGPRANLLKGQAAGGIDSGGLTPEGRSDDSSSSLRIPFVASDSDSDWDSIRRRRF